jgi:L-threonylcarbamoyladenylate synthase
MTSFSQRVISKVVRIPKGKVLTYKEAAKRAGNSQATRAVGSILAKNKNPKIPCHRVVKSDFSIGGFRGKKQNSWEKTGLLLKEGVIGVIPNDTIYGICCSVFNKRSIEKLYQLKKRKRDKPMIILISFLEDLKKFGIKLQKWQKEILAKILTARISFILPCSSKKYFFLHKGSKNLAFRVSSDKLLLKILSISGPLLAPSANWENCPPAQTIKEAKRYFKDKVFYFDKGRKIQKNSTLIDLTQKTPKIIRKGADYRKAKKAIFC